MLLPRIFCGPGRYLNRIGFRKRRRNRGTARVIVIVIVVVIFGGEVQSLLLGVVGN